MSTSKHPISPDESDRIDAIITRERANGVTIEGIVALLASEGLPLGRSAVHSRSQRLGAVPRGGRGWKDAGDPVAADPVVGNPAAIRLPEPMTRAQVSALADALAPLSSARNPEDDATTALHELRERRGLPLARVVEALGVAVAMFASDVLKGDVEADK